MSNSTNNINDLLSTPTPRGCEGPPMSRACEFCNTVFDGSQALGNLRHSCRLNYQNEWQQEDVVMNNVSNHVDQDASNIHGEIIHPESFQDDALPESTDDSMQLEAENGDASIVTIAANNEDGEFYTPDADSSSDDESDNYSASLPDFYELPDDLLNVKYKTLGIVEDNTDDLACVYDCSTFQKMIRNTYTTFELISTVLYDLVKDFAIAREVFRRLVRFMNTVMIRDKEKLEKATMKMMLLGDIVSRSLANSDTRAELRYRHEYDNRENSEPNTIADFFVFEEYKAFKNNNNFQSENDMGIALFNDRFVTTKHGGRLFTMIHVIGLSYNPQKRYKDEYVIQLCILLRKKKPALFASYLSVILAEMHYLSTYGMVVKTPDNQIIRQDLYEYTLR
ncbi:hypothetical protein [Parasitella parasitica]|uniref:Uncharacterized protein n=1 Tax=Parasitella parasitica TaxID=35722 RepID=A0A0B7NBP8_9FUNG|nr:hypothetical protein [Parasitella parasitica]